jgi:hypothetical protein
VIDILVADKQLANELEYDLRQYNAQQKKNATTTQAAPEASSPARRQSVAPQISASPRPELANFSVPRLRPTTPARATPAKTPMRAREGESETVGSPTQAVPQGSQANVGTRKYLFVNRISPGVIASRRADITLPSPGKELRTPQRQWRVDLSRVATQLNFDDVDADKENQKDENKTSEGPETTKKSDKEEETQEEPKANNEDDEETVVPKKKPRKTTKTKAKKGKGKSKQ